jgi:ribosomal-protein-alanine N-acetyltransferase
MKIRPFKETDAKKVAELSNSNAEFFQYTNVSADFLKKMWEHPDYHLFVISEGSRVIGFCGISYIDKPVAEIGPICIERGRRMEGLGRLLFENIIEFLSELGAKKLIIKVKTSNSGAQEFFAKLGFRKAEGVLVNEIPAIIMEKDLE